MGATIKVIQVFTLASVTQLSLSSSSTLCDHWSSPNRKQADKLPTCHCVYSDITNPLLRRHHQVPLTTPPWKLVISNHFALYNQYIHLKRPYNWRLDARLENPTPNAINVATSR
jgi:hypothetical protein